MLSCERCWADSALARYNGEEDAYRRLLRERQGQCTPEQQAGPDAQECPRCGRRALHQHCSICMHCGYDPAKDPES